MCNISTILVCTKKDGLLVTVVVVVLQPVLVVVILVVLVVVVSIVVVSDLLCAEAVSDTFVFEVLTGDIRVDVLIIVSNVAVDLLMDVNVNMCAGEMTSFEFVMPGPLAEFRC